MDNPAKAALTANIQYVSKLSFPWLDTGAEYSAIDVVRCRKQRDKWIVNLGGSFWDGVALRVDDVIPHGCTVLNEYEAARFPLEQAVATARRIADSKQAEHTAWDKQMNTIIERMRAVVGSAYNERWGQKPRPDDVCLTYSTHGRGPSMTGQINVFTWEHANGMPPEQTPRWLAVRADLTDLFERAGWCFKANDWGLAAWELT